jgi:beta-lactamase class A
LQTLVERLVDDENGSTAVVVRHLRTGASAAYHEHDIFRAASLAKLPILMEVYRRLTAGTLRLDDLLPITPESITDGAGVLQARAGEQIPISELLRLAVTVSDNVAARLLLRHVGGEEAVNRTMAELRLPRTRLYVDDRPNTTAAADMATLLAWSAVSGTAFGGGRERAGTVMATPAANTLAALLALPQAQAWLAGGVPRGVPVAHKSGQFPSLRHDAALVFASRGPYIVVGLTDELASQDDAEAFLVQLSRQVYTYFSR